MMMTIAVPRYLDGVAVPCCIDASTVTVHIGPQPMATLERIAEVGRRYELEPRSALMMWAWGRTRDGRRFRGKAQ